MEEGGGQEVGGWPVRACQSVCGVPVSRLCLHVGPTPQLGIRPELLCSKCYSTVCVCVLSGLLGVVLVAWLCSLSLVGRVCS